MSNRQNDARHNASRPRGVNNQDPQARHDQESQDWKDAQKSQDEDAPGGKRRFMHGDDADEQQRS